MVNGVGGSAGHYGSWLRRFHPWQFAPKSHYDGLYGAGSLPEDCTLADWPVTYDQLEPFYTKLEHLIGIAGDESNPFVKRSKPLPLPATRPFILGNKFTETTKAAGLHPHPVPVGFTTESYGGRPATGYSAWNNGLGSFRGDRWHPGLGPVPAAIETGNFELRTHSRVTRIIMDDSGAARGVEWVDPLGRVRRQYARAVILSAYTYENLRLMYLSADSRHENGLGNNTGQLGMHYMTKMFGHVDALFPGTEFNRHTGPAAQGVVLDDFLSPEFRSLDHGFIGGATLGAEQQALPLQIARETLPEDVRRWGAVPRPPQAVVPAGRDPDPARRAALRLAPAGNRPTAPGLLRPRHAAGPGHLPAARERAQTGVLDGRQGHRAAARTWAPPRPGKARTSPASAPATTSAGHASATTPPALCSTSTSPSTTPATCTCIPAQLSPAAPASTPP
jgi:hypothetical protein